MGAGRMSADREARIIRAHAAIDTGRELLAELNELTTHEIGPLGIGRLEASLDNAITRLGELLEELADEMAAPDVTDPDGYASWPAR